MFNLKQIVMSAFLVLFATLTIAVEATSEQALVFSIKDAGLKWGPCPAFLPKGCQIAVLHGDPSKNNADVFFKVPGGATIAEHWHTSAERMILVSGRLDITYQGQKTRTLKPGMYAYGPAKASHKAVCAPGPACILFIAFESPVDAEPTKSTQQ